MLHDSDLTLGMDSALEASHLQRNRTIFGLCGTSPLRTLPETMESMPRCPPWSPSAEKLKAISLGVAAHAECAPGTSKQAEEFGGLPWPS